MRRIIRIAALAAMLGAAPIGHAALITYEAALGPEVSGAAGSGSVEVLYDSVAHTILIDAE